MENRRRAHRVMAIKTKILSDDLDLQDLSRSRSWYMLRRYFGYRLLLAILLVALFFSGAGPFFLGVHNPALFAGIGICYLGLAAAAGLPLYLHTPNAQQQAYLLLGIDILAIPLLMHASGGVTTGLGMLLLISIAFGSSVMRGRNALGFAALATFAILGEQFYSQTYNVFPNTAYTQAGMLGASFFAMAILADALSRRLRESEQLASQRGLDLANLEQLNEYVIQHIQTGVVVVDTGRRVRLMNEAAWHLLGIPSAATGLLLAQLSPELSAQLTAWEQNREDPPTFRPGTGSRELQTGFARLGEGLRAGTLIFLDDTATVSQRAQQLKLASLGRLTASIAHEIRNPLGAISHAGQLLEESDALIPADQRLIDIIRNNSARVNEIVENVLQISRRQSAKPKEIRLEPWLKEFVEEFQQYHALSAKNLQVTIQPQNSVVRADPGQLRQILTSLCDNALSHFNRDRGELQLQISGGVLTNTGGPFLEIRDNGPGIDPEAARQIFEPFFTTRTSGSGLGLYIAKELCEANRLVLEHIQSPGDGCCFRISFPRQSRDHPVTEESV